MKHLTKEQRYTISVMHQSGHLQKDIAKTIGKDKSVVSRELRRNCDKRNKKYHYELSQRKYEKRIKEKPKCIHFKEDIKKRL